jgi:hypothetical protein
MTLDAAEIQQITQIAQAVTAEAIRNLGRGTGGANLPIPIVRLGTVGSTTDGGGEATVRPDGDANAVPASNATGSALEPGDRVLISYLPPLGVYITSRISRADRGLWTPTIGGPSSNNTGASGLGHYTREAHRVTIEGSWSFGAGTALGSAATLNGLPFPVISDGDGNPTILSGYILDVSASARYPATWVIPEGNTGGAVYCLFLFSAPGLPGFAATTTTAPMTWTTSDTIYISGTYNTEA